MSGGEIQVLQQHKGRDKDGYLASKYLTFQFKPHSGRFDQYLFGVLLSADKKQIIRHQLLPDSPTIEEQTDRDNGNNHFFTH